MKRVSASKMKLRLLLVVLAWILVMAAQCFKPDLFEGLDAAFIDRLAVLSAGPPAEGRAASNGAEDPVVYIDANFYYDRSYHARVIRNLAALKTTAQFVDFVFEENIGDDRDQQLVEAVAAAGGVYLGISFGSLDHPEGGGREAGSKPAVDYMDRTKWWVDFVSPPDHFYMGQAPRMTASRLATVARGSGFLNLTIDDDGILRRTPLLVRYRGALYPSLAFQAACDYLGISPADIVVDPGESITLRGAKIGPEGTRRDIVIPIDDCGRMLVNFASVRRPIRHYSYRDIFRAFEDPFVTERLKQELPGKIAIISENVEADVNVRPVGGQRRLTTGTVHAAVIRNILTETFLCRLSGGAAKALELVLLSAVFAMSLFWSSIGMVIGVFAVSGLFMAGSVFAFTGLKVVVPFTGPILMTGTACILILVALAAERAVLFTRTEKAKQLAEHELDIGRQIQSGFFPTTLPKVEGWEIAAHFQAAHHVSGDFYDAFPLSGTRHVGLVIADVCDKGVGAALYMAIFRSLIRILSRASADHEEGDSDAKPRLDVPGILKRTIRTINDYISVTHEKDGMFATIFFGILDTRTGELSYVNGGHEPPLIVGGGNGVGAQLMPTGPAVGANPDTHFSVKTVRIDPGEIFLAYTDGVTEARNPAGAFFTKGRLIERVASAQSDIETPGNRPAGSLIDAIRTEIEGFAQGEELFDDITLLAVGRRLAVSDAAPARAGAASAVGKDGAVAAFASKEATDAIGS